MHAYSNKTNAKWNSVLKRWHIVCVALIIQLILFLLDYLGTKTDRVYQFSYLSINFLLSSIFAIQVLTYYSSWIRVSNVKYFFNNNNYKNKCNEYYKLLDIMCEYGFDYIFIKTIYSIIWFGSFFVILHFVIGGDVLEGYSGYYTITIFIITMVTNWRNYYRTIAYVHFLYKLSCNSNSSELKRYKYNFFYPSQTIGFQSLMSNVNYNSVCFMFTSLLYNASFLIFIITNKGIIDLNKLEIVFIVSIDIILGMVSCIFVFITPKFLLRRILRKWIEKTISKFEKYLDTCNVFNCTKKNCKLSIMLESISELKNERIIFKSDILQILTSIITVVVMIITFLVGIFT